MPGASAGALYIISDTSKGQWDTRPSKKVVLSTASRTSHESQACIMTKKKKIIQCSFHGHIDGNKAIADKPFSFQRIRLPEVLLKPTVGIAT